MVQHRGKDDAWNGSNSDGWLRIQKKEKKGGEGPAESSASC